MPCRPGPTPVSAQVWFTSVTLGNSAIAPPRRAQPRASRRATFGSCAGLDLGQQVGALGAVPQQPDDVRRARLDQVERRPLHVGGVAAAQRGQGGADVDGAGDPLDDAALAHARAGQDQRRPGLHAVERAVLAQVAALLGPVVRAGVDDGEVGCPRVGEQRVQRSAAKG
jgi:hypothetical protein